jgi:ribosomal protein L11 methyltransferase
VDVPAARAEEARAQMIELFPQGFEELDGSDGGVELVAYTDPGGEERLWHAFGGVRGDDVASGWEDNWKQFHKPVRIGAIWVGPPWEEAPADALAVVVDPGRAFGTGAHATTRLCIELLQDLPRGSLLDVGCGSGVLSIAAAKLGFAPVTSVDVDPAAVESTAENARRNGVEVEVSLVDALAAPLPAADVAIANIALEPVGAIARRVDAVRLVTSGYLEGERPDAGPRWRHVDRCASDGWAADAFDRV